MNSTKFIGNHAWSTSFGLYPQQIDRCTRVSTEKSQPAKWSPVFLVLSLSLFWWNAVNWSRVVISEQSLRPCAWHSGQPVQHIWRNVLAVITLAWHGPQIRMDFCLIAVFFWRNVIWCIQAKESVQTRLYGKPLWRAGCQLNCSKSTISWTGIARAIRTRNKNLIEV